MKWQTVMEDGDSRRVCCIVSGLDVSAGDRILTKGPMCQRHTLPPTLPTNVTLYARRGRSLAKNCLELGYTTAASEQTSFV